MTLFFLPVQKKKSAVMICANFPSELNQCTRCMCCYLPEYEGNPLVLMQQSGGTVQTPRSLAQSMGQSFRNPLTGSRIVQNSISCSLSSRLSLLLVGALSHPHTGQPCAQRPVSTCFHSFQRRVLAFH